MRMEYIIIIILYGHSPSQAIYSQSVYPSVVVVVHRKLGYFEIYKRVMKDTKL